MGLEEIIEDVRRVLDEKDSAREEALKRTREIIRLCGDAIKASHRGDLDAARERLENARREVAELGAVLSGHPDIYFTGYVQTAHQEFVEAALFLSFLSGEEFPSPDDLGVPPTSYILGVGDFIGELRRHFLMRLLDGDVEGAGKVYSLMQDTYDVLMTLDYPKGLVNIRVKQDQARRVLERSLEDLSRARLSKALEDKLEGVEKLLDGV